MVDISMNWRDSKALITVEVGEVGKEYLVHKELACRYSAYFRSAFTDRFIEGQEGRICISHCNEPVFDNFIRWLYSQDLPEWDKVKDAQGHQAQKLVELYIFADYCGAPALKKLIIDKYIAWSAGKTWQGCHHSTAGFIYLNTPDSSPLRRLIVDEYLATCRDYSRFHENLKHHPVKFVDDLLVRSEATRDLSADPITLSPENYYDKEVKGFQGGFT